MEKNKGFVLMIALIILVLFTTLGLVSVSIFSTDINTAFDALRSVQALYLAEAGKQYLFEQLSHDPDWSDNADIANKAMGGGVFNAEYVEKYPSSALIKFSGIKENVSRKFTVNVSKAVLSGLNGVYIGGQLNDQGATNLYIESQVQQNYSDLPTIDYSYYESIADHTVYNNQTFTSGTYSGIWYVDGNVYFQSNVTLDGSIIATGNVDMSHDSNINVFAENPYPALISEGNFLFQDTNNINITGLVYVGADMQGTALGQKCDGVNITGTMIVAGNFNIQNSSNVTISAGDDAGAGIIDTPIAYAWQETN